MKLWKKIHDGEKITIEDLHNIYFISKRNKDYLNSSNILSYIKFINIYDDNIYSEKIILKYNDLLEHPKDIHAKILYVNDDFTKKNIINNNNIIDPFQFCYYKDSIYFSYKTGEIITNIDIDEQLKSYVPTQNFSIKKEICEFFNFQYLKSPILYNNLNCKDEIKTLNRLKFINELKYKNSIVNYKNINNVLNKKYIKSYNDINLFYNYIGNINKTRLSSNDYKQIEKYKNKFNNYKQNIVIHEYINISNRELFDKCNSFILIKLLNNSIKKLPNGYKNKEYIKKIGGKFCGEKKIWYILYQLTYLLIIL